MRLLLVSALLANFVEATAANATMLLGGYGPVCISVFDLAEDRNLAARNDLADRVTRAVRIKVEAAHSTRAVRAGPDCIKPDQPGYDNQLRLLLSIKRQNVKVDGRAWNLVMAGGVSTEGLFQERELQPVVILQQQDVSDDSVVTALVEFVDRTLVAALRRTNPSYDGSRDKVPELR